jgi:hypothetical protein
MSDQGESIRFWQTAPLAGVEHLAEPAYRNARQIPEDTQ